MADNLYEPSRHENAEPAPAGRKAGGFKSRFPIVALFAAIGFSAGWVQGAMRLAELPRNLRCGNIAFDSAITACLLSGAAGLVVAAIVRRRAS